jgi:hypothetical protein
MSLRAAWKAFGLMVRVPGYAIQWSSGYKRARSEFRRQLVADGIPHEEARELADLYPFKMSEIIEAAREVN